LIILSGLFLIIENQNIFIIYNNDQIKKENQNLNTQPIISSPRLKNKKEEDKEPENKPAPPPNFVQLAVPYINEAPEGIWEGPWKNACEEASITMIEKYYQGKNEVSIKEAKEFMIMLFEKQNEIWNSNTDADAQRATRLIHEYTNYQAKIIIDPTIEKIKEQLNLGQPVISLHYGKELNNPNIPFLTTGSYYHMMVIIGYDNQTQEFITNDDGDIKTGAAHRYDYDLFMNSLHDFIFETRQANGPAKVIFTQKK